VTARKPEVVKVSSDRRELEERVVQPTEIHDTLAQVETMIRDLDEPFVRVTVEGVTAEKHAANRALVDAIEEADGCLNCGAELEEGGFCGLTCLQEWDGDDGD
jgi:hypothetical protein